MGCISRLKGLVQQTHVLELIVGEVVPDQIAFAKRGVDVPELQPFGQLMILVDPRRPSMETNHVMIGRLLQTSRDLFEEFRATAGHPFFPLFHAIAKPPTWDTTVRNNTRVQIYFGEARCTQQPVCPNISHTQNHRACKDDSIIHRLLVCNEHTAISKALLPCKLEPLCVNKRWRGQRSTGTCIDKFGWMTTFTPPCAQGANREYENERQSVCLFDP